MDIISSRTIVLDILQDYSHQKLSLSEIVDFALYHHNSCMNRETIIKAIDELKALKIEVKEDVERRGKYKLPIKTFQIIKNQ